MTKKGILSFILAALAAGGLWAQENETEPPKENNGVVYIVNGKEYETAEPVKKARNSLTLYISPAFGLSLSYEFFVTPSFSVGVDTGFEAYLAGFLGGAAPQFLTKARFYPGAGKFFLGLGLGAAKVYSLDHPETFNFEDYFNGDLTYEKGWGLDINPELGFRFDPGRPNGFILFFDGGINVYIYQPSERVHHIFNNGDYNYNSEHIESDFGSVMIGPYLHFGIGYAF